MKKLSLNLPLLFLLLVAAGCSTTLPMKNIPLYWDAGKVGAIKSYTESDDTELIEKDKWDEFRKQTVAMSYDDFAWIQNSIQKMCFELKSFCKKEEQKKIAAYINRIERVARIRRRK